MQQRIITAIFFVAAMLGGIFLGAWPFAVLFALIGIGALWELGGMLFPEDAHLRLFRRILIIILGILPFVLSVGVHYLGWHWDFSSMKMLAPIIGILLLIELFLADSQPFSAFSKQFLGVLYVGIPLACLAALAYPEEGAYVPMRVMGVLGLVWASDTMGYFVGRSLGKTPFFPRHSPKKTWEGTLGGAVSVVLIAYLASQFSMAYFPNEWLTLGAVVGVLGTPGDLVESMLKRSVGAKDSGQLLPGHGGLLDRFDAFFFVLPFVWWLC